MPRKGGKREKFITLSKAAKKHKKYIIRRFFLNMCPVCGGQLHVEKEPIADFITYHFRCSKCGLDEEVNIPNSKIFDIHDAYGKLIDKVRRRQNGS